MNDFKNRQNGLLFGSLIADALSLGAHWIYDTEKLSQKFGYITNYYAPGIDSYHPHKQAGEQSHTGDQAVSLAKYLNKSKKWNAADFMEEWLTIWPNYKDYSDHATKTTLQNLKNGRALEKAGSDSSELAGPARIAPLIARFPNQPEEEIAEYAEAQTELTHASKKSKETAKFLAISTYRILHGASLESTVQGTAPQWALKIADKWLPFETNEAISEMGQSCSIEAALPAVLYLALKYTDDLPKAFSENVMAGGDNCARGLALGMLLGAANGIESIPIHWQTELSSKSILSSLLLNTQN